MKEVLKDFVGISFNTYKIDGEEVLLDIDVAELYQVELKEIYETVRKNPGRFPKKYVIELSEDEFDNLKPNTIDVETSKGHIAFIEQGVFMLSTLLDSERAIEIHRKIISSLIEMKNIIFISQLFQ